MKVSRVDLRLNLVFLLVGLAGAVLLATLWYMQVVRGEDYARLSAGNRIRLIRLLAPRGLICDRHGEILADNRPAFDVVVNLPEVEDRRRLVDALSVILDLSPSRIQDRLETFRERPFEPVRVAADIGIARATVLEEKSPELKGVQVVVNPARNYPAGQALAHLLGYVGQISPRELGQFREQGYRAQDDIGKSGVEEAYDLDLRGTAGGEQVQVNARGYRDQVLSRRPAQPGKNLHLTVDLKVQLLLRNLMEGYSGAAVALDPRNGDILALVSNPSFDPNLMVRPVDDEYVQELFSSPDSPLLNRAISGEYPPGSIFKLVVALAALEHGNFSPGRTYDCAGVFILGDSRFRCWKEGGHGSIDLSEAIKRSCNIYFYRLGLDTGVDRIEMSGRELGFGQRTGIALKGERAGLMPGREWKRLATGQSWFPGDTVNLSIGQGYVTVTPLQIAVLGAALARKGRTFRPRLVTRIVSPQGKILSEFPPQPAAGIELPGWIWDELNRSLFRVVNEPGGTAHAVASSRVPIAGKTGTAQSPGPPDLEPHSWFLGMAPAEEPEVVVAVILENVGSGSEHAAPVAGEFLAEYFAGAVK